MTKGVKKMNFPQFGEAIEDMAKKKKITVEELSAKIIKSGGPVYQGTKAKKVKLHDDKECYIGVFLFFSLN